MVDPRTLTPKLPPLKLYIATQSVAAKAGGTLPGTNPATGKQGSDLPAALAGGCTVVRRPSELRPLGAGKLAELAQQAGLPEGVLNVVPGYGDPAGEALARHPDVDKISCTGSIRTARRLLHASADTNLKK